MQPSVFLRYWSPQLAFCVKKKQKRLGYSVDTVPLVESDAVEGSLRIFFNDTELDNAFLIFIDIENIGSAAIPKSDFEVPLHVRMAENTRIVSAELTDSNLREYAPIVETIEEGTLRISPVLLNPGDHFSVRLLVDLVDIERDDVTVMSVYPLYFLEDNLKETTEVTGRVIGISEIERDKKKKREGPAFLNLVFFAAVAFCSFGLIYSILSPEMSTWKKVGGVGFSLLGLWLLVSTVLYMRNLLVGWYLPRT